MGWDGYGATLGIGGGFPPGHPLDPDAHPERSQAARKAAKAASFLWQMASGLPSGVHGAFLEHSIDALSVRGVITGRAAHFHGHLAAAKMGAIIEACPCNTFSLFAEETSETTFVPVPSSLHGHSSKDGPCPTPGA